MTDGTLAFRFDWLKKKPPFDDDMVLRELLSKINAIPGIRNRFGDEVMAVAKFPLTDTLTIESIEALKCALTFIIDSVKSDCNTVTG